MRHDIEGKPLCTWEGLARCNRRAVIEHESGEWAVCVQHEQETSVKHAVANSLTLGRIRRVSDGAFRAPLTGEWYKDARQC